MPRKASKPKTEPKTEPKQTKADKIYFDLATLRFYKTSLTNPDAKTPVYERDYSIHKAEVKNRLELSKKWRDSAQTKFFKLLIKGVESKQVLLRTFPWMIVMGSQERTEANLNELLVETIKSLDEIGEEDVALYLKDIYEDLEWKNYTPKSERPKEQRSLGGLIERMRLSGDLKVPKGSKSSQTQLTDWIENDKRES